MKQRNLRTTALMCFFACTLVTHAKEKLPFELQRIQDARENKIKQIDKQYKDALLKQKKVYLKRKDQESAKLVDTMLSELAGVETAEQEVEKVVQPSLSAIEATEDAKISSKAKFVRFKKGVSVWDGDGGPSFVSVPDEFKGRKIMLRILYSTEATAFEVEESGVVTIVSSVHPTKRLTKDGWVAVGKATMKNHSGSLVELHVFQKILDVGKYSIENGNSDQIRVLK